MRDDNMEPWEGHDDGPPGFAEEILRELNEPPIVPAPADRHDDRLPFDRTRVSVLTLVRYGRQYWNHEALLAQVMPEIYRRDYSQYVTDVRELQRRWECLNRIDKTIRWPRTAIAEQHQALDGRRFQGCPQGMLGFFGYHVGRSRGLLMSVRHEILDYMYTGRLPIINDDSYTRKWGEPNTGKRLRKLSSTIAYLARNAQANENADYADAVSEWAADLQYLRRVYFRPDENPEHDWEWPVVGP